MPAAFRLYLLRHARSSWAQPGQTDFERALDDVGFGDAEIIADMAADRGFVPNRVLCSTATRCRQTIEPFLRAADENLDVRFMDTLYTGNVDTYRTAIAGNGDAGALMIVGHNPAVQELFFSILDAETAERATPGGYQPGTLAVIDFDTVPTDEEPCEGRLVALLSMAN